MRFNSFKALGIAAIVSLAVVFGASATANVTAPARQVPVSTEIQTYFSAHGVDQNLVDMIHSDLRTYAGLFASSDYMVFDQDVYSYSTASAGAGGFTTQPLTQR